MITQIAEKTMKPFSLHQHSFRFAILILVYHFNYCIPIAIASQFVETEKFIAGDFPQYTDSFGQSVSVRGNALLVGAPADDHGNIPNRNTDEGSAFVYKRDDNGKYIQVALLHSPFPESGANFGSAVSLGETTALVAQVRDGDISGGPVYVFEEDEFGNWTYESYLLGEQSFRSRSEFGTSLSLSNSNAIVGAPGELSGTGAAYVFSDSDGGWRQATRLTASDGAQDDDFGFSVSLDCDTAIVGAPLDDDRNTQSGSVYLFREDGSDHWTEIAKLNGSDSARLDQFGWSVALHGNTAIVGAIGDDDKGDNSGSAYIFQQGVAGKWSQIAKITASDGEAGDLFGWKVAIHGNTAIVGARLTQPNAGSVYVFQDDGMGNWHEIGQLLPTDIGLHSNLGSSLSIWGSNVAAGSPRSPWGAAYVFKIPEPRSLSLGVLLSTIGVAYSPRTNRRFCQGKKVLQERTSSR